MLKYCNSKSILHFKHFCLSFNFHYVSIPVLSKVLSCKQLTCLKVQMYCDLDILMSVTFFVSVNNYLGRGNYYPFQYGFMFWLNLTLNP